MEEMEIVFENDEVVVVDKPAGWISTNENNRAKNTVENWLRQEKGITIERGGLVHRLDRGTSGLLLAAKNETKLKELKKLFKDRKVVKKYWALVSGEFPFKARVEMPIDRDSFKFDRFAVREDGKMAITDFTFIKKYKINGKIYSLIEADLKTGRTHQIRVHLKYLKWPIVGDKLYGGELSLDRPFLHSIYLKVDGIEAESKLRQDLLQFLNQGESE